MAGSTRDIRIQILGSDKSRAAFAGLKTRLAGVQAAASRVQSRFAGIAKTTGLMVGGVTAAGAGIALATKSIVDTSASFERLETVLSTIEGSSEAAKESMRWVEDFTKRTPYELEQVAEGFVRLRAYGMDPTNGLMKTLGDTSAAMGKDLMAAVEAIADAVTGENERLKEFGIKARAEGDQILYEYSANGKTMVRVADKSNRQMIQSTLEAIWNEKYAGAMDKLSRTWGGMSSNLADRWTDFKKRIGQAGVFDRLKDVLAGVLDQLKAWEQDGTLDRVAKAISDQLVVAVERAVQVVKDLMDPTSDLRQRLDAFAESMGKAYDALKGFVDLVGGPGNAALIAMAAYLAPTVLAVGQLAFGLGKLALTLGPIFVAIKAWALSMAGVVAGLIAIKLAVLAAAFAIGYWIGTKLVENWDTFKAAGAAALDWVRDKMSAFADWVVGWGDRLNRFISPFRDAVVGLANRASDWLNGKSSPQVQAATNAAASTPFYQAAPQSSESSVVVDFRNLPRGTVVRGETKGPGEIDLNLGWSTVP